MITVSHTQARDYIQQMADGETLRAEARQALQQHLAECPECRTYAQEIKALHLTLSRAFRARWEHQPVPDRPWPYGVRRPAHPWKPLIQVMAMLMMTVMVLSLLPEWSRLPAAPATLAPTETVGVSSVTHPRAEAVPDEGLENLASEETAPAPSGVTASEAAVESEPYFLNDPDNRAARAH